MTRAEREHADEDLLDEHREDPSRTPAILAIHPPPGSPVPGRLERDIDLVKAGLEAGRDAAHAALVDWEET